MKIIYKYKLDVGSQVQIELPHDAKILCFKIQNEIPHIWALVDPNHPDKDKRIFAIYGTGWDIEYPMNHSYIGTDFSEGSFVWHCFEII